MVNNILIFFISLYKGTISPLLRKSCRHYPSCSDYALECLHRHPTLPALFLIISRIIRCNPFSAGGYDPVPETFHVKHLPRRAS